MSRSCARYFRAPSISSSLQVHEMQGSGPILQLREQVFQGLKSGVGTWSSS